MLHGLIHCDVGAWHTLPGLVVLRLMFLVEVLKLQSWEFLVLVEVSLKHLWVRWDVVILNWVCIDLRHSLFPSAYDVLQSIELYLLLVSAACLLYVCHVVTHSLAEHPWVYDSSVHFPLFPSNTESVCGHFIWLHRSSYNWKLEIYYN